MRLASTARTGSARTRCSTSSSSGAVAATTWRRTRRRPTSPLPAGATRHTLGMLDGILARETGDNVADIRSELQDSMFDLAFVVRTEESLAKMQRDPRRAPGAVRPDRDRRQGQRLQHGPDGGRRGRVPAGLRRDARRGRAQARDESRGAHYREDHPLRDDANWLKHSLAYRKDDGSIRLDYEAREDGSLHPDGAEVLMATPAEVLNTSDDRRVGATRLDDAHAQDPAIQPRRSPRRRGGTSSRSRSTPSNGSSRRCTR